MGRREGECVRKTIVSCLLYSWFVLTVLTASVSFSSSGLPDGYILSGTVVGAALACYLMPKLVSDTASSLGKACTVIGLSLFVFITLPVWIEKAWILIADGASFPAFQWLRAYLAVEEDEILLVLVARFGNFLAGFFCASSLCFYERQSREYPAFVPRKAVLTGIFCLGFALQSFISLLFCKVSKAAPLTASDWMVFALVLVTFLLFAVVVSAHGGWKSSFPLCMLPFFGGQLTLYVSKCCVGFGHDLESLYWVALCAAIVALILLVVWILIRSACAKKSISESYAKDNTTPSASGLVDVMLQPLLQDKNLTDREYEVLQHFIAGKTSSETAECMGIKAPTVRSYLQRAYKKLGVRNAQECKNLLREGCSDVVEPPVEEPIRPLSFLGGFIPDIRLRILLSLGLLGMLITLLAALASPQVAHNLPVAGAVKAGLACGCIVAGLL